MSPSLIRRGLDSRLLQRLLEDPDLAPALRALPAPALRRVILQVGLEDAGELIALASLDQLREVFDEDLWRSTAPGQDEAFDAARFVVWLEVLLEGGDAPVADRLAELSEDFLVLAFSQLLRVLDVGVLETWSSNPREAELLDRILDEQLGQELDDFLLVSRNETGWDALWTTVLALDERHSPLLRGVLERCAAATHEELQSAHKLHAALGGDERVLEDARAEREGRRAERGYVAPADARAFLALARTRPQQPEQDPITRAHFRELEPRPTRRTGPAGASNSGAHSPATALVGTTSEDEPTRPAPLRQLLLAAGVDADAHEAPPTADSLFRRTLGALGERDPEAQQRVLEELAYLSNVLIAGDTNAGRTWLPAQAAERVLELCDRGLRSIAAEGGADPDASREALRRWGAVGVFRIAWAANPDQRDSDLK